MFGRSRKPRSIGASQGARSEFAIPFDSTGKIPTGGIDVPTDEDIPTVESPHVTLLNNSRGGPYYLAPNSADPLPNGIWADLDPNAIDRESTRVTELLESGRWHIRALDPELREFLQSDGVVGKKVIEILAGESGHQQADPLPPTASASKRRQFDE